MSSRTAGVAVAVSASTVGRAQLAITLPEAQVRGPEIVPPRADAVRLVDDEQRDLELLQDADERFVLELFRRDEDDLDLAACNPRDRVGFLIFAQRRVERDDLFDAELAPACRADPSSARSAGSRRRSSPAEEAQGAGSTSSCLRRWQGLQACFAPPRRARPPLPAPDGSARSQISRAGLRAGPRCCSPRCRNGGRINIRGGRPSSSRLPRPPKRPDCRRTTRICHFARFVKAWQSHLLARLEKLRRRVPPNVAMPLPRAFQGIRPPGV